MFPNIDDQQEFVERIRNVCQVYKKATDCDSKITVTCSDEKTGIQAINSIKTTPAQKGRSKRVDTEYKRNGTSCLMAALHVKTGKIASYSQSQTRNEQDFLNHIKDIIATNPKGQHIIVCDQINTHKSESLVKWVAQQINYNAELGVKGKSGILESMKTRMEFLEDNSHRIRFQYTPKHCSWMNQIENWFGILQKKVIKHGQFHSVNELEQKIENFILYHNKHLAKPINWKFNGRKYMLKLAT